MSDEHDEEPYEPMSLRTKVIAGVVLFIVLAGGFLLIMRLSSPRISSSRTAPTPHYPLPCTVCHTVTADPTTIGTP